MKEVTKIVYKADDGTEFDTKKICIRYEKRKETKKMLERLRECDCKLAKKIGGIERALNGGIEFGDVSYYIFKAKTNAEAAILYDCLESAIAFPDKKELQKIADNADKWLLLKLREERYTSSIYSAKIYAIDDIFKAVEDLREELK